MMRWRPGFWRHALAGVAVAGALAVPALPAAASAATHTSTGYRAAGTAAATCSTSRPHSGTMLFSGIRGGFGRITIKNHLSQDSVIMLVRGRSRAIGVYVRAHATTTVRNIKPGTYTIYFTAGSRYSVCQRRFTSEASYWRVKNRLPFASPPHFTVATLTLFAAKGSGSPTTQIGPSGFPPP
jgi:hypothetical protein